MSEYSTQERLQHYVGSYLYLCGKHVCAPSRAHASSIGRRMPKGLLEKGIASALEVGWATLDDRKRLLWTPEGERELTTLHNAHMRIE